MKAIHILMVLLFASGMGAGQLLLKLAAYRHPSVGEQGQLFRLLWMVLDWPFLLGALLYVVLMVSWVWLLTFLPLSRAYPFTFVSMIVATIGGAIIFGESISLRFLLGVAVITAGLILIGTE